LAHPHRNIPSAAETVPTTQTSATTRSPARSKISSVILRLHRRHGLATPLTPAGHGIRLAYIATNQIKSHNQHVPRMRMQLRMTALAAGPYLTGTLLSPTLSVCSAARVKLPALPCPLWAADDSAGAEMLRPTAT
jgi:hypothetical protein